MVNKKNMNCFQHW